MGLTEVMEILTTFQTNIISDFYKIIEMLSKSLSPLSVIIHDSLKICVGCRHPRRPGKTYTMARKIAIYIKM